MGDVPVIIRSNGVNGDGIEEDALLDGVDERRRLWYGCVRWFGVSGTPGARRDSRRLIR